MGARLTFRRYGGIRVSWFIRLRVYQDTSHSTRKLSLFIVNKTQIRKRVFIYYPLTVTLR